MAGGFVRALEWVFCVYFVAYIPSTVFFDSQQIFPAWMIPKMRNYKVAVTANTPEWLLPLFWGEIFLQLPFFFVGAYAFYNGDCPWVRIPCLIYAVHMVTYLQPFMAYILFHDFSDEPVDFPGPATFEERLWLLSVYLPFFIIPMMILLTMIFSRKYNGSNEGKQKSS